MKRVIISDTHIGTKFYKSEEIKQKESEQNASLSKPQDDE